MKQNSSNNKNGKAIPIKAIASALILFFIILVVGFMIIPAYFDKTPFGKLFQNGPAPWAISEEEQKKYNYSDSQLLGRNLYLEYCSSCHGPNGKGDGPLSVTLRKRAPNFLDPSSSYKNGFSRIALLKTIENGITSSEMPNFNYLPKETKEHIIDFLIHMNEHASLY